MQQLHCGIQKLHVKTHEEADFSACNGSEMRVLHFRRRALCLPPRTTTRRGRGGRQRGVLRRKHEFCGSWAVMLVVECGRGGRRGEGGIITLLRWMRSERRQRRCCTKRKKKETRKVAGREPSSWRKRHLRQRTCGAQPRDSSVCRAELLLRKRRSRRASCSAGRAWAGCSSQRA